jgi:hypothetical protein
VRPGTLRAYALGVISGSIVTAGLAVMSAPEAKADSIYDETICAELDADPTVSTIVMIGLALGEQGYTGYESGRIVGTAVIEDCQQHIDLMRRFADMYAPSANPKVI